MLKIEDLKINSVYTNDEISEVFKCSKYGGMKKSKKTNSLVLIAKHNDSSYADEWTEEGILNYTGMGLFGDQDVDYRYNKDLGHSNETDISVYLFESFLDNEYYYRGEVYLCGEVFAAIEPDKEGNDRVVYKFPIKPKEDYHQFTINESSLKCNEKEQTKNVQKLDKFVIKSRAKNHKSKNITREVIANYRHRDPYVAEYTKNRALGICDLCHNPAPFKKKNGEAYLEEHHVITLADGGPDAIYNTVALCPNCHKKVHVLNHKDDVFNLKRTIFNYLKNDNDEKNLKFFNNLFTEYQKINN